MSSELILVIGMAVTTTGLRYAGFGLARFIDRYPRAKQALSASGFCLMVSYLAIQVEAAPQVSLPIAVSLVASYVIRGIFLPLLLGWGTHVLLLNFS